MWIEARTRGVERAHIESGTKSYRGEDRQGHGGVETRSNGRDFLGEFAPSPGVG